MLETCPYCNKTIDHNLLMDKNEALIRALDAGVYATPNDFMTAIYLGNICQPCVEAEKVS